MTKIAIDIVLLPPEEIMDKVIELNKQLKTENQKIPLNKKNCLPHLSLCMGIMDEAKQEEVIQTLKQITENSPPLNLKVTQLRYNEPTWEFSIEKTEQLQELHEMIVTRLKQYLTSDGTVEMLYPTPPPEELSPKWINGYTTKYSFENFNPHITVSTEPLEEKQLNIQFTATRLALAHLGNYCTVRKILKEFELR